MRYRPCLLLCLLCLALACPALAEQPAPLGADELFAYRDAVRDALQALPIENDPSVTHDPDGADTWLFAFLFGLAELSGPSVSAADSRLVSIEILSDGLRCPRGIALGDPLAAVLAAYPNDNPALTGDAAYAALYVRPQLPDAQTGWAWLLRRGAEADCAQYAVSLPAPGMDGFRLDLNVLYVLREGRVASVRVTGFDSLIGDAENLANLSAARDIAGRDTYAPSASGGAFAPADFTFCGIDLREANAQAFADAFGAPLADTREASAPRTLVYAGFLAELSAQSGGVTALLCTDAALSGPRGLRVGEALPDALARFGGEATGVAVLEGGEVEQTFECGDASGRVYLLTLTFRDDILIEYLLREAISAS
ncbi:hypothetical protein FACS1894196_0820 [Clostridia bacterium]|nr:hypothetical protein FACS1894196_0820 [Clostridia bacterium]